MAPDRVNVPAPVFTSPPLPLIIPLMVVTPVPVMVKAFAPCPTVPATVSNPELSFVHDCTPLNVIGSVAPKVAAAVPDIVIPPVPMAKLGVAVPAKVKVPS